MLDAASYGRVFRQAKRSRDKVITVLSRSKDQPLARLGLAISKKHCKSAVQRNRIKRVVRESFRQHQSDLTGIDIVVLNHAATHRASNRQLFESLAAHWQTLISANRKQG
jgi:ribonuclease P protein component